jgi:predicted flap endonuclease-1-like 5' DNA nuclease
MSGSPRGKAKPYDQTQSKTNDISFDKWMSDTPNLMDATTVPGIGKATATKLGVRTAYQLLGRYLQKVGVGTSAEDAFKQELHDAGVAEQWQDTVVEAVAEKLKQGQWDAHIEVSEDLRNRSRMDANKLADFTTRRLTGDLEQDLNGVGPKSAKKLNKSKVRNTWQLFGCLLESETSEDFEHEFKDALSSGHRAQVIEQLLERLKVGCVVPEAEELEDREEPAYQDPPPVMQALEPEPSYSKPTSYKSSSEPSAPTPTPDQSNLPMVVAGILLALFFIKFVL